MPHVSVADGVSLELGFLTSSGNWTGSGPGPADMRDMDKVHLVRLISQGGVRIQLIIEQLGVPCAALCL